MEFKEVLSRVFPVAADPAKLQALLDSTLNFQDQTYFRVTTPFVYLQLISYGEMFNDQKSRLHTSQRELLFMVPVEWFRETSAPDADPPEDVIEVNGQWYEAVDGGKGSVTPFIFVDNDLSVLVGRERFGWPKNLMSVVQSDAGWVDQISPSNKLVDINVRSLKDYYVGEAAKEHTLLEIWRSPGTVLAASEPMVLAQIKERIGDVVHLMDTQFWMGKYLLNVWRRVNKDSPSLPASLFRMEEYLSDITKNMQRYMGNCVGLKEFRDVDDPDVAAYVAIACSHARMTQVLGMGMLGTLENVLTSISGGYSIRINHLESYPIVEKLGLRVEATVPDKDGGPSYCVLAPVFPFWLKTNVEYYAGNDVLYEAAHDQLLNPDLPLSDLPPMSQAFVPPEGN